MKLYIKVVIFLIFSNVILSNEKINKKDKVSGNLFLIKKNGKLGFIDKNKKLLGNKFYYYAKNYSEGLAWVLLKDNGKWGIINKQGQVIIDFEITEGTYFHENLSPVRVGGSWGNEDNQIIGKWGFVNNTGKPVIPAKYEQVYRFSEGLAFVQLNGRNAVINKKGELITSFKFDESFSIFKEGMARVKIGKKWGYINNNGKISIPIKYNQASSFNEGLALVESKNEIYFINKLGKKHLLKHQLPKNYIPSTTFYNGLARIMDKEKQGAGSVKGIGFINKKGEIIISPKKYINAGIFSEGLVWVVTKKYLSGYINTFGEKVTKIKYTYTSDFKNGYAYVEKKGKAGYINKDGKIVIKLKYESMIFK